MECMICQALRSHGDAEESIIESPGHPLQYHIYSSSRIQLPCACHTSEEAILRDHLALIQSRKGILVQCQ